MNSGIEREGQEPTLRSELVYARYTAPRFDRVISLSVLIARVVWAHCMSSLAACLPRLCELINSVGLGKTIL